MHSYTKTQTGRSDVRGLSEEQVRSELDKARALGLEVVTFDKGVGYETADGGSVFFRCYCSECYGEEN